MTNSAIKKILYANQSMGMGGAETFLADLLTELQNHQWQVVVATTNSSFANLLEQKGISTSQIHKLETIIDVIGNWKGLLKAVFLWPMAIWQWKKVLENSDRSSLVLLSGFSEKLLVTPLAKQLGFTVLWIEFSSLQSVFEMWGGLIGKWYARTVHQVDGLITSSRHSQTALYKELANCQVPPISVIPCGSSAAVEKLSSKKLLSKKSLKKNHEQRHQQLLVCISRLQPGKGQDLLLQAMPLVLAAHPTAQLAIIGEGDYLSYLQELSRQLNLEKAVTFTGRVESIQSWLANAAVSIFPSVWELEGFGLVVIESMAAGVPVVAFDRGPSKELLLDQTTGLLVESGSVAELARAIIRLLSDTKLATKLAQAAQKTYQDRYTIQQVAKDYDQYFARYYH